MGLNIRHAILTAPATGGPGLSAPPPGAGVLPGITRTTYTGPATITTAGTIVQNKNISPNGLVVNANNVQIINCTLQGGDFTIEGNASGLIADHCTIDSGGWGANSCIATGDSWTVTNCNLSRADNGMMMGSNGRAEGNYIHNLGRSAGTGTAHVDGMQTTAAAHVIIRGNWVESFDTSDIILKCDDGPIDDFLIEGNTLIADPLQGLTASAIYCYSLGSFLCTNVTIRNNRLQKNADGGYIALQNSTPTITGNVDYITGAPVTG